MAKRPIEAADPDEHSVMEVYVVVADDGGGGEVVLTVGEDEDKMPVAAVERTGLENLRDYAQYIANRRQTSVSIICFTVRTLHDTLFPTATGDKTS